LTWRCVVDLEGDEIPGNSILNVLFASHVVFLTHVSTLESLCIELHCIFTRIKKCSLHSSSCVSYRQQIKLDGANKTSDDAMCRTRSDKTGGVEKSSSR